MIILQELENIKYHFVLNLIKKEEQYDKRKSVINAYDVYKIFYNRFLLLQKILLPLKNKLGEEIDITSISFTNSDDENGIVLKYIKDDRQYLLSISNYEYEEITIVSTDLEIQNSNFAEDNRQMIFNIFKEISNHHLDKEIVIKSTTGKIIIQGNYGCLIISDFEKKVFSLEEKHSNYSKTGNLNEGILICNYPKLKELLMEDENVLSLYNHINIYEDELSKNLIKKVN